MTSSHLRLVVAAGPGGSGDTLPLDDFREYLIGLGLADATIALYTRTAERAIAWAAANGVDLMDISPSDAVRLAGEWPYSAASRRQLKSVLTHYWTLGGVTGQPGAIRVPSRPPSRWRGIERDQVRALLARARTDWPRGGVVYLGVYLGLRREEIATLRWRDFDPDLSWVTIMGKGDRTRYLPVHERVREILRPQQWPGEWVFPGRLGGHVAKATINEWVAAISEEAGIGRLTPHQMRHTFGARINDASRDIYLAKDMLGHVDVKTTQVYTRMELARLEESTRYLDWEDDEQDEGQAA